MAHSYKGKPKYYCKTQYLNSNNTGCVTSVLDETLEQIVIDEFNYLQKSRLNVKKIMEEQLQQRKIYINQIEMRIHKLSKVKEGYDNEVMLFYESYKDGKISEQEYLDERDKVNLLQEKLNQDISNAYKSLKELKDNETIGLEVFDVVDSKMQLKKLDRAWIEQFVKRINVNKKEVDVEWKFNV